MEIMELDGKTDVMLPCFTFSYFAAGESYSGRFSLLTDGQNEGESVAQNMMKRTIEIQYDPKRPSTWYIPDKTIGGYEVGQRLFPGRTPYPKD
jgi:hypothetical protein